MVSFFILLHPSFQVTFHKLLFIQSINSIVLVTRLSSALDHYPFSFSRPPRAGAYIFLHPDLIFLNSTDSHTANTYQVW